MTPEVATVVTAVVQGAAAVLASAVAVGIPLLWRELRRVGRDVAQAREQVKNDHGTNLRDDLDGLTRQTGANTEAIARLEQQGAATHHATGAVALEVRKLTEQLGHGRRQSRWRR